MDKTCKTCARKNCFYKSDCHYEGCCQWQDSTHIHYSDHTEPVKEEPQQSGDIATSLNRLAREQMKQRLLKDIATDLAICDLEGWNKTEYINEIAEIVNGFKQEG